MTNIIETTLEALLFGSTWYFGFLIILMFSIGIMKAWKYSGAVLVPLLIVMEVAYYQRVSDTPELVWAMICFFVLILAVASMTVLESTHKKD